MRIDEIHIKEGNTTQKRGAANEKDHTSSASSSVSSPLSSLSSSASVGVSPQYRAPIKHNMHRRKAGHDYARPGAYLITVETTDRQHLLGTLQGDSPDTAHISPTTIGEAVIAEFRAIEGKVQEATGCHVQVLQYQLMPDHFHGILYICEQLPQGWHLGKIIGAWKGACSRAYWEASPSSASSSVSSPSSSSASACNSPQARFPLFSKGYNDRPLLAMGQLQGWIAYLRDNPRRLWLKHHYPDRLRKEYNLTIGNSQTRYTAVGNTFLLTYPERQQVRCHRNLTEEQIQNEVDHYLHIARTGVVLVSPFISPAEKAVYEACYKERLTMVRLVKRALDGKFIYPQGRDFDACVQGFLVVLAPFASGSEDAADLRISRTQCLTLNDCAAELASSASRRVSDEYNGYIPSTSSPSSSASSSVSSPSSSSASRRVSDEYNGYIPSTSSPSSSASSSVSSPLSSSASRRVSDESNRYVPQQDATQEKKPK